MFVSNEELASDPDFPPTPGEKAEMAEVPRPAVRQVGTGIDSVTPCRRGCLPRVTDATGTVTSAGAWEPYGRPRAVGPNNPNAPPLGWLGQYQDPTGLTHLRARQYDPAASIFLSTDPAAATSISGTYTYGSANPLRYIDITGLFSWDEALGGVQDVSGIVSDVAGVLAIVAAATGVGAPVAAVFGGISIAAGAVHAGTKAIQAYNTCTTGKGSCGDAVAEALLSAGTIPPGAKLIKGAANGAKSAAGTIRHYTTRRAAQSISKSGSLEPGSSGKIWLTPDKYASGAETRAKLALNKTPDGYFEIPLCRVKCPSPPSRVQPYYGQPGGGTEVTTEYSIDVSDLGFIEFR